MQSCSLPGDEALGWLSKAECRNLCLHEVRQQLAKHSTQERDGERDSSWDAKLTMQDIGLLYARSLMVSCSWPQEQRRSLGQPSARNP